MQSKTCSTSSEDLTSPKERSILSSNKYDARKTLYDNNIMVTHKLARTLQGSIYRGTLNKDGKILDIVVKRASKSLQQNGLAFTHNKFYRVDENILKEAQLMAFIQSKNPPKGFVKIFDLIEDDKNYFLIMSYGGLSLFNHVIECHKLIIKNKLTNNEWNKHVLILFKQMVNIIDFLHNIVHCCHMDISIENFCINNVKINNGKFISHGQVNLIDFGLMKLFDKTFQIKSCVSKINYTSPEMYRIADKNSKNTVDARKCDVWSLGVCYFMMQIGASPFTKPHKSDSAFCNIMNGYLKKMTNDNGKSQYLSDIFLNIIEKIFCKEKKRFDVNQIKKLF